MIEFKIEDMTCGHCASMVTRAIKSVDGNAKIEIDVAKRRVAVETEEGVGEISEALIDAGYRPTLMQHRS